MSKFKLIVSYGKKDNMALKYTTTTGFAKYIGMLGMVPDPTNNINSVEEIGTGNAVKTNFYLKHPKIIGSTLVLTTSAGTTLTLTTHYTVEELTGIVTLTSAGVTALAKDTLLASYRYFLESSGLDSDTVDDFLEATEKALENDCSTVFTNQTSSPAYLQIEDESLSGQGYVDNGYELDYYPIVKISTTTSADYTTGATSLFLTDVSELPATGTIYVGGNKVSYSAITSLTKTLTIPSTTPSISSGAIVKGEVVEMSTDPSGSSPSFTVLVPGTDYELNYDTGVIQISETCLVPEEVLNRVKVNYYTAYRLPGKKCEVPGEIENLIYKMAALEMTDASALRANLNMANNFSRTTRADIETQIRDKVNKYKLARVSRC
jgi:hypothetical protein